MTDWPYKNIKVTVHSLLMSVPLLKDFHNNKCVPSDYLKMKEVLVNGGSLSVALGGLSETKHIEANKLTVCVNKRRGIFKMAIETGVPIIPVLTYGENEIYRKMNNSLSTLIDYYFGIHIAIPTLKSLKDWLQIYKAPLENKIRTHIGTPIEVGEARVATETEIVALREKYIAALRKLYKETRSELYAKELEVI
jgi:2-acylglycerol O-acyltransferase 2